MHFNSWALLLMASLPLLLPPVMGKIVVAGVLPHGDFVFDPSLVHNENGSLALHGNATLLAVRGVFGDLRAWINSKPNVDAETRN